MAFSYEKLIVYQKNGSDLENYQGSNGEEDEEKE
jgi:hypothetical protein